MFLKKYFQKKKVKNIDAEKFSKEKKDTIRKYISKYYYSKNDLFKEIIGELTGTEIDQTWSVDSFVEFTPLSSEEEIKNVIEKWIKDSDEFSEKDFGCNNQYGGDLILQLYYDIINFRSFFKEKQLEVSLNEIIQILKEVCDEDLFNKSVERFYKKVSEIVKDKVDLEEIISAFACVLVKNPDDDDVYKRIEDYAMELDKEEIKNKYVPHLFEVIKRFNLFFNSESEIKEKFFVSFEEQNPTRAKQYNLADFEKMITSPYDHLNKAKDDSTEQYSQNGINENIRASIPESVKRKVWRRDEGKCVNCGSREKLEFDHIIPVSKGGSNTERNIELLCEKCNRKKSNKI